jgi:hypothetical protein
MGAINITFTLLGPCANRYVRLVATFDEGEALFAAVCDRGLERVVAKRER